MAFSHIIPNGTYFTWRTSSTRGDKHHERRALIGWLPPQMYDAHAYRTFSGDNA